MIKDKYNAAGRARRYLSRAKMRDVAKTWGREVVAIDKRRLEEGITRLCRQAYLMGLSARNERVFQPGGEKDGVA